MRNVATGPFSSWYIYHISNSVCNVIILWQNNCFQYERLRHMELFFIYV